MLNEQKSLAFTHFYFIDTVPTGGQVYIVDSRGVWGPIGGRCQILGSLTLAITPLHESVYFYPDFYCGL